MTIDGEHICEHIGNILVILGILNVDLPNAPTRFTFPSQDIFEEYWSSFTALNGDDRHKNKK